ncbi:MAG: Wzy polymerase domain-containing protein, partial [Burkholderiales bacterium]|nr:Wzy polymerase domain-containing protein [Burkholderiales bacterium]
EMGRRMVEWRKAYITFKEHILFGTGFYGYAKNSVFLYKLFPNTPLNSGLFINCHNLILQLLAETGIIGASIAVIGIAYAIKRMAIDASPEIIILRCMLSTTIAHSMLEYPLWYFYFLGPFIMFLSVDKPIMIFNKKTAVGISFIPIILLVFVIIKNSLIFNTLVDYIDTPDNINKFQSQATALKSIADKNILASYLTIFTLDNYINIDSPYTSKSFTKEEQLKYESIFTNFQPYPQNLIKLAKLEWNAGNKDKAKELTFIAITAFPVYKTSLAHSLHARKYKQLYNIANDKNH